MTKSNKLKKYLLRKKGLLALITALVAALGVVANTIEQLPDFDFSGADAPALPASDAGADAGVK